MSGDVVVGLGDVVTSPYIYLLTLSFPMPSSPVPFLFKPTVSLVLITDSPSRHGGNTHRYSSLHLELMKDVR